MPRICVEKFLSKINLDYIVLTKLTLGMLIFFASSSSVFSSSFNMCTRDGHSSTMTTSGRTLRMT